MSAENRRLKREEKKGGESRTDTAPITPSKQFFKSKSRIFKFFR